MACDSDLVFVGRWYGTSFKVHQAPIPWTTFSELPRGGDTEPRLQHISNRSGCQGVVRRQAFQSGFNVACVALLAQAWHVRNAGNARSKHACTKVAQERPFVLCIDGGSWRSTSVEGFLHNHGRRPCEGCLFPGFIGRGSVPSMGVRCGWYGGALMSLDVMWEKSSGGAFQFTRILEDPSPPHHR